MAETGDTVSLATEPALQDLKNVICMWVPLNSYRTALKGHPQ